MTRKPTNLRGLYARSAERADDQQIAHMIRVLQAEAEETSNPHVVQALEAFQEEAARRAGEKKAAAQ